MPGLKPCGIALFPLSLMRSGLRRRARIKIRFHRREKCRNVQNVSPHVDTKRVVEEHREIESTFRARGKFQNPIFQKFQMSKISKNVKFLFFPKSSMSTPTMFPWPLWPQKRLRNDSAMAVRCAPCRRCPSNSKPDTVWVPLCVCVGGCNSGFSQFCSFCILR